MGKPRHRHPAIVMKSAKNLWVIFAASVYLAGCGTANMTSWEGRPVADLMYAWGPPSKQQKLPDGRQVLSYSYSHQINATDYDCEAMFRIDTAGIIRSSEANGNIGGCN